VTKVERFRSLSRLLLPGSLLLLPLAALGQTAPAPPPAEAAAPARGQLEEVVVTAEHRREDINKVPMSITALSGDQLEQQGLKNISDIARTVPGLNFQSSGDAFGTTEISIRGINSQAGAAPTGIYINDTPIQVYLAGFVGTNTPYPKLFDLERVEVLEGPQGTLFGAGSEGGTVRFITPQPSLDTYTGVLHGDVSFTDDGDPSWEVGAAVGGPIVEGKLGFRASAWYQSTGGWVDRTDPNTNTVVDPNSNWQDSRSARVALKFQPTDELTITPSWFYQNTFTNDTSLWSLAEPCINVSAHCQVAQTGGPFNNLQGFAQPDSDHFDLMGLDAEYRFDAFSVKSITSWLHRNDNRYSDGSGYDLTSFVSWNGSGFGGEYLPDGQPFKSIYFLQNSQEDFDEEIRFSSNSQPGDRLTWEVGLFFQHNRQGTVETIQENMKTVANDPAVIANNGETCTPGTCTVADLFGINDYKQYTYTFNEILHEAQQAIYANMAYNITDEIKFEAGIRAARTTFDFYEVQNGPWNAHALPDGTVTGYAVDFATKREYPVTPRFSLSYQMTPDQMVYGTISEGYRIGGGNPDLSTLSVCAVDFATLGITGNPLTFNSDTVWNYEVGTKGKFFDNALSVKGDLFYEKWSNIQTQIYLPTCGYTFLENTGDAVSKGAELTAEWRVMDGLTLSGNISYIDARYTTTTEVGGNILALKGDSLGTPPLTFTVSAEHDQDLDDETNLYMRADFTYASHYVRTGSDVVYTFDPQIRPGLSTTQLNARIGVTRGAWDVSLYGNNLANTHTLTYLYHDNFYAPDIKAESQRPLTIGLTADYRF